MTDEEKKRKTFTFEPYIYDELQDVPNASQLMNSLAAEYLSVGQSRDAALSIRINEKEHELERAKSEKARIESRIDKIERSIEDLRARRGSLEDDEAREVNAVVGLIQEGAFDRDDLKPGNELVKTRAANAKMQQSEFIDYVEERL